MKASKRIHLFIMLLAILSWIQIPASAQDKAGIPHGMPSGMSVPGYVILSNGDTLPGKIKWAMKYVENNPVEIKFTAENGTSKSFNAGEIKGFGTQFQIPAEDDPMASFPLMENYVSIPSFKKGVPVFMNRLIDGRIIVYQNRSAIVSSTVKTKSEITGIIGITFTFSLAEGLYIGPALVRDVRIIKSESHASSYYVVKEGAPMIKVENDNYDSLFRTLFGDCPGIDQELDKNPDLAKFKNFYILAEVYDRICK
jgi:hypothetical protein